MQYSERGHTLGSTPAFFSLSVARKMAQYMADILEPEDKERLHENLLVGPSKLSMEGFLNHFQWDPAKFPLRQPLPNIVDGISKVGYAHTCS